MSKGGIETNRFLKKKPKKRQSALIFEIGYFGHEPMTNPMTTKRKSKSTCKPRDHRHRIKITQ
jgi:hypothetical protein